MVLLRRTRTRSNFSSPSISFVLGGVIGGILRRAGGRRTAKRWICALLIGAFTRLVIAVLYAVGVNLWGVEIDARAGQAVAFVVAVAGAWFGIRALLPRKAG